MQWCVKLACATLENSTAALQEVEQNSSLLKGGLQNDFLQKSTIQKWGNKNNFMGEKPDKHYLSR